MVAHIGRDHLITTSAENRFLMIDEVHLEPGSGLRDFSGRHAAVRERWPGYPAGVGILVSEFNKCELEEGRFNVITQTFSGGDPGRDAAFRSIFPHAPEIAQPGFTRKEAAPDGTKGILTRIDGAFINISMQQLGIFGATPM